MYRVVFVAEKEELQQQERTLSLSIENDDIGKQIKDLEKEIRTLDARKQARQNKLNEYNKKALEVGLCENPSEEAFV